MAPLRGGPSGPSADAGAAARPPKAARARLPLLLLALLAAHPAPTAGLVDCSGAPKDCAARNREKCNPVGTVPNTCGGCLLGAFGGTGPTNAFCLSNQSCGAVYPGMATCPVPGVNQSYQASQLPVVVPFGQCVCDSGDGLRWPTAPGSCAILGTSVEEGPGLFALQKCSSPTCDPATCTVLATWEPRLEAAPKGSFEFPCRQVATDAVTIVDNCASIIGNVPDSAFCGHPGLIDVPQGGVASQYVLNCEVAPRCPESVVTDNLEQTCCLGTDFSLSDTPSGGSAAATGFCAKATPTGSLIGVPLLVEIISARGLRDADDSLQGNSDPYCTGSIIGRPATTFKTSVVDDSQNPVWNRQTVIASTKAGDSFEFDCWDRDFDKSDDPLGQCTLPVEQWSATGFDGEIKLNGAGADAAYLRVRVSRYSDATSGACVVRTFAKGWKGCACLGADGRPVVDRVCTASCTLPECGQDGINIPATPQRWRTSAVPDSLKIPPRSARVASRARRPAAPLLCWVAAGLLALVPRG